MKWTKITVAHNTSRFFTSLSPAPPAVTDEIWVDRHLTPNERALWVQLGNPDRRHSIAVARRFVDAWPEAARAEIAGAILHDIGKIKCRLGTFARVAATLVGPRTQRFAWYFQHEAIGARMAIAAGSDPVTVQLIVGRGPAARALRASDHA